MVRRCDRATVRWCVRQCKVRKCMGWCDVPNLRTLGRTTAPPHRRTSALSHPDSAWITHRASARRGLFMAKYGKKAGEKVERAMHERKGGRLKSGRSGRKVTSRKQAIAIGLSEARDAGGKVPKKKKSSRS